VDASLEKARQTPNTVERTEDGVLSGVKTHSMLVAIWLKSATKKHVAKKASRPVIAPSRKMHSDDIASPCVPSAR